MYFDRDLAVHMVHYEDLKEDPDPTPEILAEYAPVWWSQFHGSQEKPKPLIDVTMSLRAIWFARCWAHTATIDPRIEKKRPH